MSKIKKAEPEKSKNITVERTGNLLWCDCSKCSIEEREIDCLCCHEVSAISEEQFSGNVCITNSEEFKIRSYQDFCRFLSFGKR